MVLIKLAAILCAIIVALRYKAPVGPTLFFAGILTALFFRLEPMAVLGGYGEMLKSPRFLSVSSTMVLVTVLGTYLRDLGFLTRLTQATRGLFGGRRTAAMALPALVGLMPMPGGAALSAPMVDNVLSDKRYSPKFKAATNYWFRHIVEFSWPIYPGIVLTEAITHMSTRVVALVQLPLTLVMALIGYFFLSSKISPGKIESIPLWRSLTLIMAALWPVGFAITLYGVAGVDLAIALSLSIVLLLVLYRPKREVVMAGLKSGFSFSLVFLVFGILSFQKVLELSGSIQAFADTAKTHNFPPEVIICSVCFVIGLFTSLQAAVVGLGYPILANLLIDPVLLPDRMLLAYMAGFLGMMFSPTHLCLILSAQFFGARLMSVYKLITIPLLILAVLGYLIYLTGWGSWVVSAVS